MLDAGALGIIVPHVHLACEAQAAVAAAMYPPAGSRGATSALPQLQYRTFQAAEAQAAVNGATMVVVMIDDLEALEAVEEIAAVQGVDLLHIGSNDLTTAIGIPGQYNDLRVIEADAHPIRAYRRLGKQVGTGGMRSGQDRVAEVVQMGIRYISTGMPSLSGPR